MVAVTIGSNAISLNAMIVHLDTTINPENVLNGAPFCGTSAGTETRDEQVVTSIDLATR